MKVTTIGGRSVERSTCISIRDEFHEKNRDCFRINDRWISMHFNKIGKDAATNQFNFQSKMKVCVTDHRNGDCALGYSSKFYDEPFYVKETNEEVYALTKLMYDDLKIEDCPITNKKYAFGHFPFTKQKYRAKKDDYSLAISKSTALMQGYEQKDLEKLGLDSKTFRLTRGHKYSFGCEIETSDGLLPKEIAKDRLNIDYVYDGSIYGDNGDKAAGAEIVTGVLVGDAGVNHLEKIMGIAKRLLKVNGTCGIHLHCGGADFNQDFTVNAYLLGKLVEKDWFLILPQLRKYELDYAYNIKGDNKYCRFLPDFPLYDYSKAKTKEELKNITRENYNIIFKWLSNGRNYSNQVNKATDHPDGFKAGYNYGGARYCWLNMIPCNFNTRKNKSYSIEFRQFTETLEFKKVYYWLLMSFAFMYFCENKGKWIIAGEITKEDGSKVPLNFFNMIESVYPNDKGLMDYIMERKKFFKTSKTLKEGDFKCA